MSMQIEIYPPDRIVVGIGRGPLSLPEIGQFVAEMIHSNVVHYHKLVDVSGADLSALSQDDLRSIDVPLNELKLKRPRGALAIVADPRHDEQAHIFKMLTSGERPVEVFRSIHDARKWLEAQPYDD